MNTNANTTLPQETELVKYLGTDPKEAIKAASKWLKTLEAIFDLSNNDEDPLPFDELDNLINCYVDILNYKKALESLEKQKEQSQKKFLKMSSRQLLRNITDRKVCESDAMIIANIIEKRVGTPSLRAACTAEIKRMESRSLGVCNL